MSRSMRARNSWTSVGMLVAGVLLVGLPSAGCGKKSKPAKMTEEEREQSKDRRESAGKKARQERIDRKSAALCDDLECTDAQRKKVAKLVTENRLGGLRMTTGLPGDHEATKALAEAFRGDTLAASAFVAFRAAETEARAKAEAKRREGTATALVGLHGELTAEQRKKLAAMVTEEGLRFLRSPRRPGARAGARRRPPDADRRAERMALRLCKQVTCRADQSLALETTLAKLTVERNEDDPVANAALANAVQGDTLDPSAVDAFFSTTDDRRTAAESANDAVWVELHGALDSEQRATLADLVAEHGIGALMGHSGRTRRFGPGRGRD